MFELAGEFRIPTVAKSSLFQRLKFLAGQVSDVDSYSSGKAHWIASRAGTFYSVRKHAKHPGGPNALLAEMMNMIGRMRAQARTREDHLLLPTED